MTKFAIITLSRIKNDVKSNKKLGHQVRKAIAGNRLLKGWKVSKVIILSG